MSAVRGPLLHVIVMSSLGATACDSGLLGVYWVPDGGDDASASNSLDASTNDAGSHDATLHDAAPQDAQVGDAGSCVAGRYKGPLTGMYMGLPIFQGTFAATLAAVANTPRLIMTEAMFNLSGLPIPVTAGTLDCRSGHFTATLGAGDVTGEIAATYDFGKHALEDGTWTLYQRVDGGSGSGGSGNFRADLQP